MAKDKERSVNPAQQARKQEKNRAIKKAKSEQQARRNEKLAHRNPHRIQRQIDDLKALESSGEIKPRGKAILADLERDLRAVTKAREALGEKAPTYGNARPRNDYTEKERDGVVLGKRGRDGERRHNPNFEDKQLDSGEDTDDSVRAIPMPRDTPPPIPREFRHNNHQRYHQHNIDTNSEQQFKPHPPPQLVEAKTTYSSAPQLRDLRKEATSRFVPSAVKMKQNAVKGVGGGLLEPEEMDRLEATGYYKTGTHSTGIDDGQPNQTDIPPQSQGDAETRRLAEEEARFERELAATGAMDVDENLTGGNAVASRPRNVHQVQMEEVEDEDMTLRLH